MHIDPRRILFWLPALLLTVLLTLWLSLATWNSKTQKRVESMRRQLQTVRAEKPALQAIQAARNARQSQTDPRQQQGIAYAVMESTLRNCGLGEHVRQLKPELREVDVYIEEKLTLNITQLDSAQLMRFLYETEKALPGMTVDSMSMRRNGNGFMDIDAVFIAKMPK